jgi:AAA+ ATPase superfamily predicted ATPase
MVWSQSDSNHSEELWIESFDKAILHGHLVSNLRHWKKEGTMANPFALLQLHAAVEGIERIRESRVDREDELAICMEALLARAQNVLVYGERGTGKSFLVRLIQDEIERTSPSVLTVTVNVSGLAAYSPFDSASAFPRAVLIQICAELWERLLGRDYWELRERLGETGSEITFRSKAETTVQEIYSYLMINERTARFEWGNSVGFSAGVKGEKRESAATERKQLDILPFEFLKFVDTLYASVLKEHGIDRIVVLCDEANLLPEFRQHEILERYLELFAARYVQFLFVAGFRNKAYYALPASFETAFELKGFSKAEYVKELIERINHNNDIAFSDEAIKYLFDCFQGHPRNTLYACSKAIHHCDEERSDEVNTLIMKLACLEYKDEMRTEEAGLPPVGP